MAKDRGTSPLFVLVATITAIAALYFAKAILLPIALAILLTFLLAPVCDRLERWRVPRIPAVVIVVGISISLLGGLGWIVTKQLGDLVGDFSKNQAMLVKKIEGILPDSPYFAKATASLNNFKDALLGAKPPASPEGTSPAAPTDSPATTEAAKPSSPFSIGATNVASYTERILTFMATSLVAPLTTGSMVIILLLFLLLDRENQRSRIVQLFGRTHLHATTEAMHDVTRRVGRYLRMLFLVNSTYGIAIAIGLRLIGLPGAITWGVLAFSLRFIPYIGPILASSIPILVSIATSPGWTQPLMVVGCFIIIELISNNVVEPMLYGSTVGISTVGILISAIFWTWLWGPVGLILATPMTVCLVVTSRYVPQLRFITVLLADQPPQSDAERVYQRLLAFDYQEPLKMARKHLKDAALVNYYDGVLVPALSMAEHDRHAGLLNDEQAAFVQEASEDLVAELGEAVGAVNLGNAAAAKGSECADDVAVDRLVKSARVLCIPLRDDADETTSRMLAQLLITEGYPVVTAAAASLTAEVVDRVAASDIDIVVISILPPILPRESRLLWKRLRDRYPNLPIIVGYWSGPSATGDLPAPGQDDDGSKLATTLGGAVALVRSTAAQEKFTVKTA